MWPFGRRKIATRLGAVGAGDAGPVEVLVSVVSPNVVTSPISGLQSALLQVELLERIALAQGHGQAFGGAFGRDGGAYDEFVSLGLVLLGEILVLRDAHGDEISVVTGRARFESATPRNGGTPIDRVPAELVPLLRRASGRGIVCYREFLLVEGDKVRLKAVVEPSQVVVTSGYRSGATVRYLARDDLAPVVLEEVLELPDF